jgi:beta-lactamase family protein
VLSPPLFSAPLRAIAAAVREIPSGEVEINSLALATRVQERHTEPTLALRVGDSLTYCTDTAPDPENADFARESRVPLHEAWYAEDSSDDAAHTAAGDAARIACEARVEQLVLIHINLLQGSDEALSNRAVTEFPGRRGRARPRTYPARLGTRAGRSWLHRVSARESPQAVRARSRRLLPIRPSCNQTPASTSRASRERTILRVAGPWYALNSDFASMRRLLNRKKP